MPTPRTLVLFAFAVLAASFCTAQMQPSAAPATPSNATPAAPSSLLQPALDTVVKTLNSLNLDKWKKGTVRQEAGDHVDSIQRDIETNLPPLLAAADASPASVSAAMPLVKHLDALYEVLLRVEEASRVVAPSEQISQLQSALAAFSTARFAFVDSLQAQALTQEKQLAGLRADLAKATIRATAEQRVSPDKQAAAEKPCVAAKPARRHHPTRIAKKPQPKPAPNHPTGAPAQKPQ